MPFDLDLEFCIKDLIQYSHTHIVGQAFISGSCITSYDFCNNNILQAQTFQDPANPGISYPFLLFLHKHYLK